MRSPKNRISILLNASFLKQIFCFLLPILMLTAISASSKGKEFWETKAYDEWSAKECQKLLENSPWAMEYKQTGTQTIGSLGGRDATDNQPPYVSYNLQIRSAHPVRQALVRQMQLAQNYDKLPVDQKKQFDQSAQSFLGANTSNVVIVYVTYSTNLPQNYRDLNQYWQTQTVDLLKNSVYISGSKGDKVPIAQYIPGQEGQNSFQFIFPRQVDGKEIITPEDKSIRLEFAYPVVGRVGDGRGFVEFKVSKMLINDEVIY